MEGRVGRACWCVNGHTYWCSLHRQWSYSGLFLKLGGPGSFSGFRVWAPWAWDNGISFFSWGALRLRPEEHIADRVCSLPRGAEGHTPCFQPAQVLHLSLDATQFPWADTQGSLLILSCFLPEDGASLFPCSFPSSCLCSGWFLSWMFPFPGMFSYLWT